MPTFTFRDWLTELILGVVVLFALAALFFRNARCVRPLGYFAAFVNILNAFATLRQRS